MDICFFAVYQLITFIELYLLWSNQFKNIQIELFCQKILQQKNFNFENIFYVEFLSLVT